MDQTRRDFIDTLKAVATAMSNPKWFKDLNPELFASSADTSTPAVKPVDPKILAALQKDLEDLAKLWKDSDYLQADTALRKSHHDLKFLKNDNFTLLAFRTLNKFENFSLPEIQRNIVFVKNNFTQIEQTYRRVASIACDIIKRIDAIEQQSGTTLSFDITGDEQRWRKSDLQYLWLRAKFTAGDALDEGETSRLIGGALFYDGRKLVDVVRESFQPIQQAHTACVAFMNETRAAFAKKGCECLLDKDDPDLARQVSEQEGAQHILESMHKTTGLTWELTQHNGKKCYRALASGANYTEVKTVANAINALSTDRSEKIHYFSADQIMPVGVNVPGELMIIVPEIAMKEISMKIDGYRSMPDRLNRRDKLNIKQLSSASTHRKQNAIP